MKPACFAISGFVLLSASVASAQGYGQPQPYGQTAPPSYGQSGYGGSPGGLQSGGLTPPSAVPSEPYAAPPPSTSTEQELDRADREDSGRGLEFVYLNAEAGVQHLGLQTFKSNELVDADTVKTTQTGPMFGVGAGVRLVFLTLGGRFRLGSFDAWQLWTLNAELGLRIPLGPVEPYITLGGGYASVGSFDSNNIGGDLNKANVSIRGFNLRSGIGVDIYLSDLFSIGANLTGEMLALTRPGVDPTKLNLNGNTSSDQAKAELYAADGSSIGAAVSLTGVAGLHF